MNQHEHTCLLCGKLPVDLHHYPARRWKKTPGCDSAGNLVPLCRRCHALAHDGDEGVLAALAVAAPLYKRYQELRGES
jgi:hypothetical protein